MRGVESYLVRVEVNLAPGLPSFAVVGLPDTRKGEIPAAVVRLVDGADNHNIECKIAGIGSMQLKSEFVKKA